MTENGQFDTLDFSDVLVQEQPSMTDPMTHERLAISFWIWALWDTGTKGAFNDLELRMTELVERGFNCIRIEGGAGLTHDADGRVLRRRLTAPDEFDFILQHTSAHPAAAIGWFGTEEKLRTLEQERAASDDPLFRITRRLHADVIRLEGCGGLLERIVFTPLQRHSGMLLYGVTIQQEP